MVFCLERWRAALFWTVDNQSDNTICTVANDNTPYRTTKLTHLLRTTFGSNCATAALLMALLTPSTQLGSKAMHVYNHPHINQLTMMTTGVHNNERLCRVGVGKE